MPDTDTITLDLSAVPFYQWDTTASDQPDLSLGISLDSIHVARELPAEVTRPSIFRHHTLQPTHTQLIPRPEVSTPLWVFVLLLLTAGMVCLFCQTRKIKIIDLMRATINRRMLDRLLRDSNLTRKIQMLPMGLMLTATIALPIQRLAIPDSGLLGYLLLFLAISLAYVIRNNILRLLGSAFDNSQGMSAYIASNYTYHLLDTIVLLLLCFPMFYLPGSTWTLVYIAIGFCSLALVLRLLRSLKLFLTQSSGSYFYLFYYLCTVELIPILVLIKWIS